MEYDFREIEKKWRKNWAENKTFSASDDTSKPKYYVLDMFPYPSGAGLHVGHPLGYIASDIYARYKRLQGYNVLHPMGYDSFGLPAEQYAIQTGQHPDKTTKENIARYRDQLDKIGFSFDWDREVRTSDPNYYKWTQWIFIQLFNSWYNPRTNKAEKIETLIAIFEKEGFSGNGHDILTGGVEKNLAPFTAAEWKNFDEQQQQETLMNFRLTYLGEAYVNWCPALGTVLANDEVKDGFSERGGHPVERKLMRQWSMRITAYAQRLLDGLDTIDWSESIKEAQRNWIGRSEGALLRFQVMPHPDLSPALSKGKGANTQGSLRSEEEQGSLRSEKGKGANAQGSLRSEEEQDTNAQGSLQSGKGQGTNAQDSLRSSDNKPGYLTGKAEVSKLNLIRAKEMRDNPTPAESKLWSELKTKQLGLKIRQQHLIDIYIVDFVCLSKRLVIEVDGDIHDHQVDEDLVRTQNLITKGFKVIRFKNDEVLNNIGAVIKQIKQELNTLPDFADDSDEATEGVLEESTVLPPGKERGWEIEVFTTRPDTIFGVSFVTLAPEHELVSQITTPAQKAEVDAYVTKSKNRSERERMADVNTISGVFTGSYVLHPFTGKQIPIWVGDYVLVGYGTGAVMAVPAHDERDYKFAKHFNLPITFVIEPPKNSVEAKASPETTPLSFGEGQGERYGEGEQKPWAEKEGKLINSDFLNGLDVKAAIKKAIAEIDARGLGKKQINYRLRDAVFGRQRYWGEPIPVYYQNGTPYVLNENELPLTLPEVDKYLPTEDGEPPLARANNWKYYPTAGSSQGEEDKAGYNYEHSTMPGWAGSSWYFLRYMDPHNTGEFVSKEKAAYWNQVDLYIGGSEHATGHLLYSRFWNKFLFDLGYITFDEPFKKLINQGMILGRSSLLTAMPINFEVGKKDELTEEDSNLQMELIKQRHFVSKNLAKKIVSNDLNQEEESHVAACLKPIFDEIKNRFAKYDLNEDSLKLNTIVFTRRVDIKYIDNDILNIKDASKDPLFSFLNKSQIVPELDGTYICGNEVEKMSKTYYNVQTPDELVEKFGADTLRLYEMFLGPLEQAKPWDTQGINGVHSFLRRFWRLFHNSENEFSVSDGEASKESLKTLHKTIKKIQDDLERFSFNTGVSNFMIATNEFTDQKCNNRAVLREMVILLSSYAPHIAEELWEKLGEKGSVTYAPFPKFNPDYLVESSFEYPVSFNGKMRFKLELPLTLNATDIEKEVMAQENTAKYLEGKAPKKVIVVPGKIVNIVM
ncbi:MAG: leucine--tRNA ligase [Bacteroidetes bacterium]|nr:leucine--tRNA ligase [Bacteroidota bacterium]